MRSVLLRGLRARELVPAWDRGAGLPARLHEELALVDEGLGLASRRGFADVEVLCDLREGRAPALLEPREDLALVDFDHRLASDALGRIAAYVVVAFHLVVP